MPASPEVLYVYGRGVGQGAAGASLNVGHAQRYPLTAGLPVSLRFYTWDALNAAQQAAMGNVQWWIDRYARTRTWILAKDARGVEFCLGHVRQFHGTDSTAVPADDLNGGIAGTDVQGAALRAAGEWCRSVVPP